MSFCPTWAVPIIRGLRLSRSAPPNRSSAPLPGSSGEDPNKFYRPTSTARACGSPPAWRSSPTITSALRSRASQLPDQPQDKKQEARRELIELGWTHWDYPETPEFQKVPRIGTIGPHLFDTIIQTPHRFLTKQKLHRYCKLGIEGKSSGDRRQSNS